MPGTFSWRGPREAAGWRSLQLPDTQVASYFLEKFGRPDRTITCECERTNDPDMVQVLHLSNGDAINQKLQAKGNAIERDLAAGTSIEKTAEELYLSALARRPTDKELAAVVELFTQAPAEDKRAVVEDVYWSVLSSKEFLFNH